MTFQAKRKLKREFLLDMGIAVEETVDSGVGGKKTSETVRTSDGVRKAPLPHYVRKLKPGQLEKYRAQAAGVEKRVQLRRKKLAVQRQKAESESSGALPSNSESKPKNNFSKPRCRQRSVRACADLFRAAMRAFHAAATTLDDNDDVAKEKSTQNMGGTLTIADAEDILASASATKVFTGVSLPSSLAPLDKNGDDLVTSDEMATFLMNALQLREEDVVVVAPVAPVPPPEAKAADVAVKVELTADERRAQRLDAARKILLSSPDSN